MIHSPFLICCHTLFNTLTRPLAPPQSTPLQPNMKKKKPTSTTHSHKLINIKYCQHSTKMLCACVHDETNLSEKYRWNYCRNSVRYSDN